MSHEVEKMAYVGAVPWHGLGANLQPNTPLEVWCKEAGLDWTAKEIPVYSHGFDSEKGWNYDSIEGFKALRRSDNNLILGIVSDRYKVLQPAEILEFFRDVAEAGKVTLETAGCLRQGKRIWSLVNNNYSIDVGGGDILKFYTLLATGFTGDFGTIAMKTTVRVVCNNTLQAALSSGAEMIKIPHTMNFNADVVRGLLGLDEDPVQFQENIHQLVKRKVDTDESLDFFADVYYGKTFSKIEKKQVDKVVHLDSIRHNARGQDTDTARGTAWGLVNAVTHYEDFARTERSEGGRLYSAWFGEGRRNKKKAWEAALELAA